MAFDEKIQEKLPETFFTEDKRKTTETHDTTHLESLGEQRTSANASRLSESGNILDIKHAKKAVAPLPSVF